MSKSNTLTEHFGTEVTPGGYIIWLTGLSGSGKTTLARAIRDALVLSRSVEILDGDEMRQTLCKGLGYSRADRAVNVYRIGFVARLLARNGVVSIVSAISPYCEDRDQVRRAAQADGVSFIEVFLEASIESLVARDVKGLYKRALGGELQGFSGISDPYEPPPAPHLRLRTDEETVTQSLGRILAELGRLGLHDGSLKAPAPGRVPKAAVP
jgi:adenylylsulfate kinase